MSEDHGGHVVNGVVVVDGGSDDVDHVGGVRADDGPSQDLTRLPLGHDLDEAVGGPVDAGLDVVHPGDGGRQSRKDRRNGRPSR